MLPWNMLYADAHLLLLCGGISVVVCDIWNKVREGKEATNFRLNDFFELGSTGGSMTAGGGDSSGESG